MKATRAENINPSMLTWARETAGLSVEDAARRVGLQRSARETATQKLEALERGDRKPTRKQLLEIAKAYRRPLTAFYLARPPAPGKRGEDFRTSAGTVSREEAALLDALLRDIHVRQDMAKSILEDDEPTRRLDFVGSIRVTTHVKEAVQAIQETLDIETGAIRQWGKKSSENLFSSLRARSEEIGAFVLLIGDLGSHHTRISSQAFRGFAIADDIAPFIVINDQDAKSARPFTLIHELTHIFLGSTGISNDPSAVTQETPLARVEQFCNDVAGEFLLPEHSLPQIADSNIPNSAANAIGEIARGQGVSEPMVAYRYWRLGRIDERIYKNLVRMYAARFRAMKEAQRKQDREENRSGPSYYTVRQHRLGHALIELVGRTLRANELTHTKAARILGVKPSNVEQLLTGVDLVSGSYRHRRV